MTSPCTIAVATIKPSCKAVPAKDIDSKDPELFVTKGREAMQCDSRTVPEEAQLWQTRIGTCVKKKCR